VIRLAPYLKRIRAGGITLHPEIRIAAATPASVLLRHEARIIARVSVAEGAAIEVRPSTWHPQFGVTLPTACLQVRLRSGTSSTHIAWDETACGS